MKLERFPFPSLESAYIGFTLHFLCGSCPDMLTTNNVSLYESLTALRTLNFVLKGRGKKQCFYLFIEESD